CLFILSSCEKNEALPEAELTFSGPPMDNSCAVGANNDVFACVRTACTQVKGSFDETSHECTCPDQKTFTAWDGGRCVNHRFKGPQALDGYSSFAEALHSEPASFERRLSSLWTLDERTSITLTPGSLAKPEFKRRLAEWIDGHGEKLATAGWVFPGVQQIQIIVGPTQLAPPDINQILAEADLGVSLNGRQFLPRKTIYYEPDLTLANFPLSPTKAAVPMLPPPPHWLSTQFPVANELHATLWKQFADTERIDRTELYTRSGCAGSCVLHQKIESGAFTGERVRALSGGVPYIDSLALKASHSPSGLTDGLMLLNRGGGVSLLFLFKHVWEGSRITTEVFTFDRNWRSVALPYQVSLSEAYTANLERISRIRQNADQKSPRSVICESAINLEQFERAGLHQQLLVGPKSDSLLGWVSPAGPSWVSLFAGVSPLSNHGLSPESAVLAAHTLNVHQIFHNEDIWGRSLPIDAMNCLYNFNGWKEAVAESETKVINLSASIDYDRSSCEGSPIGKAVSDRRFLWVTAAGNFSQDGDAVRVNTCPQGLAGAENLLVVAAAQGSRIAPTSNYGALYADIAADGRADNGSHATSWATPRVARAAADLAFEHPNFTAADIRRLLIISAYTPNDGQRISSLPVRSGGLLDLAMARKMARRFLTIPDTELIRKNFCRNSSSDSLFRIRNGTCLYAESRIQRLLRPEIAILMEAK
ncbi:MAG: S8 family serine peptidase, partial [Deltaproteobacteria bacterium]|nr:S8 family serine peptidase [Deltaproteobacteria bacterium]